MKQGYDYRDMTVTSRDLLRGDTSKWASRPHFSQAICESGQPAAFVTINRR